MPEAMLLLPEVLWVICSVRAFCNFSDFNAARSVNRSVDENSAKQDFLKLWQSRLRKSEKISSLNYTGITYYLWVLLPPIFIVLSVLFGEIENLKNWSLKNPKIKSIMGPFWLDFRSNFDVKFWIFLSRQQEQKKQ